MSQLAESLRERHGDPWFADFIRATRSVNSGDACRSLADAIDKTPRGARSEAAAAAANASRLFRIGNNAAGRLRAERESVYILSRSFQSERCLERAGQLATEFQLHRYAWLSGQLELERSMCAARLSRFDLALRHMNAARRIIEQSRYSDLELRRIGLNASLQTTIGNLPESWRENWRGLELFWKGSFPALRAYQFFSELSHAAERDRMPHIGYLLSREALVMIILEKRPLTEAMARYRLAMFAVALGHREEATAELAKASASLGADAKQEGQGAYETENTSIIAGALADTGRLDEAESLLRSIDVNRAAGTRVAQIAYYRRLGTIAQKRGDAVSAKHALVRALQLGTAAMQHVSSAAERASLKLESSEVYRALAQLAVDVDGDSTKALCIWESFRDLEAGATAMTDIEQCSPRFHAALKTYQNATLLSYLALPDRLLIWSADARGITFRSERISSERLSALCDRLLRLCATPASDPAAIKVAAKDVFDAVIAPISPQLQDRAALLLQLDGPLSDVPFELLAGKDGVRLGDQILVATPKGIDPLKPSKEEEWGKLHALLVGNPKLGDDLQELYPPLPDAQFEAEDIATLFDRSELLIGKRATAEAILKNLPSTKVFHFAGHAIRSEEVTSLLTAETGDGMSPGLDASHLRHVRSGCKLAVLSVCRAGVEGPAGPVNPSSLVQSFWRSGVETVIASRWNVDSRTTSALFQRFYRLLLTGNSPVEALRAASRELRRKPETDHPYYWAAFHVFGGTDAIHH